MYWYFSTSQTNVSKEPHADRELQFGHVCIILWQIDAAMQQPDTDSNVPYATVSFRMHQRRPFLGNG
jgi:hypothetical protein